MDRSPRAQLQDNEVLYVGIDIGKATHYAGLVSPSLLKASRRWELCPSLKFDQSAEGFRLLLEMITSYAPLARVQIALEQTGHYHKLLEQFLREQGLTPSIIHIKTRPNRLIKSDKRDALSLANHLYNVVGRDMQPENGQKFARPVGELSRQLRGLVQSRYELSQDIVRRKNRLTAILDELFPELTQIYADPNSPSALKLRDQFPTPTAIANATLEQLATAKLNNYPGRAKLARLQQLATTTIGTKDTHRLFALEIEQRQLIAELRMFIKHEDALIDDITRIVSASRSGQILLSFECIGPVQAATILAYVDIANFENEGKLRSFLGWAPGQSQTGTSLDSMVLRRVASNILKHTMYFVTLNAIKRDPWKSKYTRLVERKCNFDERTQKYTGKMKCVGRIAGDLIGTIYYLLRKDYDLLQSLAPGAPAPAPTLYDVK